MASKEWKMEEGCRNLNGLESVKISIIKYRASMIILQIIEARYFYEFIDLLLIDYRGWSSIQICFEVFNCDINCSQTGGSC